MFHKKVLVVIPARMNSTRFPGKPLYLIKSKPLIEWVYLGVKESKWVDKIVIATDHQKIEETCKSFGAEVCMTSTKHLSGSDRITEVISKKEYKDYEIVVNVQGDQPLVNHKVLEQLLYPFIFQEKTKKNKNLNNLEKSLLQVKVSTLKKKITTKKEIENTNIVKVVTDCFSNALYFSRQAIPYLQNKEMKIDFYEHIGLYAYKKDSLLHFHSLSPTPLEKLECLEQMRLLENNIKIYVGETKEALKDVNAKEDIKNINKNFKFSSI